MTGYMHRGNRALWAFLGLSTALHALAFLQLDSTQPLETIPVGQVQLVLEARTTHPTGAHNDNAIDQPGARKAASEHKKTTVPPETQVMETKTGRTATRRATTEMTREKQAAAVSAPAPATAVTGKALQEQLRGRLRHALLPHFNYPMLARRRGWEGTVRISIRVEADGTLSHLQMVEASQHRVLDEAAVSSLSRIVRLPDTDSLLAGRHVDLVLPVEYRLL